MKKASSKISADSIILTGLVSALIYYALNLVAFFPSEQLRLMAGGFLKLNLFVYSFCVWFVGMTLLSALLYLVTMPLGGDRDRRGRLVLRRFIVYFVLALVIVIGHAVWMGYARLSPLLPSHVKVQELRSSVVFGTVIALIGALILSLLSGIYSRRPRRRSGSLVAFFVVCLVYVVVIALPVDYARLGGGLDTSPARPPRFVILGLDAGSWNVILPFIERGDLPAMKRMMDEGTYGYFECYGPQYTPPSWTTIATGSKEADHGVHSFANVSSDWRAAPLWSIMSSAGRRVGVANWVCSWPPFEVNGAFISGVVTPRTGNAYFSEDYAQYREPAEEILNRWEYEVPKENAERVEHAEREISQLERIDEEIISKIAPDFIAYTYFSTDKLQHIFWKDMAPETFTTGDWKGTEPNEVYADAIRECYLLADGFLGDLMARYGDNAYYLVISDHGARPVNHRKVDFDMEGLLEQMGYLVRRSGEVDYESSVCYLSPGGSPHFLFNIDINPSEYKHGDEIDGRLYHEVRARVERDLRAARFKHSGKRLFADFRFPDDPADEAKADIRVLSSRALMEMAGPDEVIVAGGVEVPARSLMSFHIWSGRHRARGIVLARGPEIRHRYSGAWTIDDAYTRIFRYIQGIYPMADVLRAPLKRLHLTDEVTTLDIAPTVLYLCGLPVAENMDGEVLKQIIKSEFTGSNPVETVPTYRMGEILQLESDPAEEAKMKERLKALGYIQ